VSIVYVGGGGGGRAWTSVMRDASRYERGEIWWHENRDDIAALTTKIRACELNAGNATRVGRRLGCFVQHTKLRVRRQLTHMAKNVAQFLVEQFYAYIEALHGPNGTHSTTPVFLVASS